jgi:hypothetical protein
MLQAAIYRIDELDEAAVMQALFDGTFNGTKMSWDEINALCGTARWNRNYAKQLKISSIHLPCWLLTWMHCL